jgi:hypothetical protein
MYATERHCTCTRDAGLAWATLLAAAGLAQAFPVLPSPRAGASICGGEEIRLAGCLLSTCLSTRLGDRTGDF